MPPRDYVVFSDDWGRHPSSSQHLFRRIAAGGTGNRVLWVETIGLRRPRLTAYDVARTAEKLRGWLRPRTSAPEALWAPVPPGLVRYSPPMHPFYGSAAGAWVNDVVLRRLVRRKLDTLGMERPLLLTTVPNIVGLVGHLGERAAVYYCVDDFETWPGYEARAIRALEDRLVERADALVVTAEALVTGRARPGVPLLRLPHGVDVDMFAQGGPEPDALRRIPRPRLLCLGLYDSRVDVALLDAVADARPDWQLLLVGRRTASANVLDTRRNVHVLPPVPYADVPAWLQGADVLLIPYVRNDQTDTINPLKLREFLASGRPVAATALPEIVRAGGDLVPVGDGPTAFIAAVERALAFGPEAAVARRSSVAADGWDARAATLERFLAPLFER